ncbi:MULTISPECIES: sensor histidine kinase [Blautia]|uniref:sensor histidine kinase n=1 Tax=Blautia TaxID=572511 RepID=UPI001FAAFF63|nr:ATP-binding protein [Blautia wexlerae]MDB6461306.1 ATP-binding protein [Blautia wexlerae]MDB6464713.1 ATP-binding protein [Blautia wexlerae]MDB6467906.1 ATP-binding protein [Blautia wexlerae]
MTKKIFKSIMFVCALVLAVGLAAVMGILYSNFDGQMRKELSKEAAYLAYGVEQQGLDYLKNIKDKSARITYIDQDGTVLFDNEADVSEMKNHSDRTEFQKAEKYGAGESSRYSDTLSEKTIYYALRLKDGTVLRVSGTQDSVLALVENLIFPLCGLLCLMLILSGIMASAISKRIVKPINELDLESPEENQIYEELSPLLSKIYRQNREIQNQLELAKQQQEEFALITENMQEGLIVIDKYTMILSANSSAWNLFHVDRVRQGESVYCLDREEEFRHAIEQVLSGEHTELVLKLNGSDIQLIANPVIRDKKTEGAVVLLVNVTEKLERESLRREFSANVSHELKTPLTSISGFAEIMQGGLVKNEDIPKFAGRIYKESQRLLQLVEDVIQISQLDEEKTSYVWEPVDVYQVCKNAFESLKEKAKSLNVHLYICGERMKMEAVRTLLEEAIYNVCDNAIKYNRNDGSVSVFLTQTAQEIQIVVKDTGVGIPKEDQDRVFERFYRVDKSHSKEIGGTGLGLSIVKHAVGALKGSVILRSEEGNGTEICMKFPKVYKE